MATITHASKYPGNPVVHLAIDLKPNTLCGASGVMAVSMDQKKINCDECKRLLTGSGRLVRSP